MTIYGVSFDLVGKQPIVLLKTADANRFLPIWIGHPEATAILMRLQGNDAPRPMTHDLFVNVLGELEAEVVRVDVTHLKDNTFYARITLRRNGGTLEVDSRPSDAIALAVRCDAPIFAADEVLASSSIEMEDDAAEPEDQIEEFRKFLDDVRPEDFGASPD
jgi:bifunctional DNase/RNase